MVLPQSIVSYPNIEMKYLVSHLGGANRIFKMAAVEVTEARGFLRITNITILQSAKLI